MARSLDRVMVNLLLFYDIYLHIYLGIFCLVGYILFFEDRFLLYSRADFKCTAVLLLQPPEG